VYNSEASKPFRETNYEPEVFYQWSPNWDVFGFRFNGAQVGFNHMSNGQDGLKSRSWNRIIASALFSDEDSLYYLKTWYRLPENEKTDPFDATGDDNPDILDFYGRVEFGFVQNFGDVNLYARVRNNLSFSDNRSGIELNLTYPINKRYDLLLQYFNGYGDSLIDYNRHVQRISLGVELRFL
jgi:phospholipase A1